MARIGNPFASTGQRQPPMFNNPAASYGGDSVASTIASLGQAFFPDPLRQLQGDNLQAQLATRMRTEQGVSDLASRIGSGADHRAILEAGTRADRNFRDLGQGILIDRANTYGAAAPQTVNAQIGAGESFGSTATGQGNQIASTEGIAARALAGQLERDRINNETRIAAENQREQARIAAQQRQFDNSFETVVGGDGVPRLIPRSQVPSAMDAGGSALASTDQVAGNRLAQNWNSLTPDQQNMRMGVTPTARSAQNYFVVDQSGNRVGQGTTVDGGRTDSNSGQQIVLQPGQSIQTATVQAQSIGEAGRMEAPTAQQVQLTEAESTVRTTLGRIRNMQTMLSDPNADQSLGIVGRIARFGNEAAVQMRALSRAITQTDREQDVTREGSSVQSALDAATDQIFGDRFRQLQGTATNTAVMRSAIQDLAYAIAKAQDPSGRLSNQDVVAALQTLGAADGDPTVMSRVLDRVGSDLVNQHNTRVQTFRGTFPNVSPNLGSLGFEPFRAQITGQGGGAIPGGTTSAAPVATGQPTQQRQRFRFNPATGGIE